MDINSTKTEDAHEDETWARIAPDGGIYRLNALEVEHLKHVEDLHLQFIDLVDEFDYLLEPALEGADIENLQPSNLTPKYRLLLNTLRKTPVQDHEKDTEKGALKHGFMPLTEFLLASGTARLLGGAVLLPADPKSRARSWKNKLLALVIMMVQVCSPVLLFLSSIRDKTVQAEHIQTFFVRFGTPTALINEVTCLGSTNKVVTTILGASFLVLFIEVTRAYCHDEVIHSAKEKLLPTDSTWRVIGQITNMWVIFWSVVTMPWLFLQEHNARDIIFDSLGLLFVFSLDDLGGDALDYLKLENETFQKISGWTMGALIQCPIKIRDIVNPRANQLKDIFQLKMGQDGLQACNGPNAGNACGTRLMEDTEADENTPLKSSSYFGQKIQSDHHERLPYEVHSFKYCVRHADSGTGQPQVVQLSSTQTSGLMILWNLLTIFLTMAEIVFPIAFILMYNPCTKHK